MIFCVFGLMISVGFLVVAAVLALIVWTQDDRQEYMARIDRLGD